MISQIAKDISYANTDSANIVEMFHETFSEEGFAKNG
jgi:hypothetical protein